MNKTLYDIQPGDKVLSQGRWHESIHVVERVTKNYIIVHGQKFRKSDGSLVSSDPWTHDYITPLTPELMEQHQRKILHQQLCTKIKRIDFTSLTIEQLQAILDVTQCTSKHE